MSTVTWSAGTSGDWLTGSDWSSGAVPSVSDTAVFGQPAGTSTSPYTVTVGPSSFADVAAIDISAASATEAFPVLTVSGQLQVGTLNYETSVEQTPIDVLSGGLLTIQSAITDASGIAETITVAGTGTGSELALLSTSVFNSNVSIAFSNNASSINAGILQFASGFTPGMNIAQAISGFAWGDTIDVGNVNLTGDTASYSGTTLTIKNGSTTVLTFSDLSTTGAVTFSLSGGVITAVCYAAGTRILTPSGERRVENLRAGDLVVIVSGEQRISQPVKWIGRRRIDLTEHPLPETVAPIRIQRGAFAENMPHRDLRVSPDHAILVSGKLVCARQLVNGMTIWQEQAGRSVEYFHVELDAHAILLAEGLPAESYLNTGNDGFFSNADAPTTLHPNLTSETAYPLREAASVAPFVWDEATVRPIWQSLADRARTLGHALPDLDLTTDPELHIVLNGRSIGPLHNNNGLHIFCIPPGTREVRLVSRVSSPVATRPWLEDRRPLGVYTKRIVLRGTDAVQEIPLDHPELTQGWWAIERDDGTMRRWTSGEAVLPLPMSDTATILEIDADCGGTAYVTGVAERRRAA
jgi:antigen 43